MQNLNIKLFLSSKKEEKTFSSPLFIKVKICLFGSNLEEIFIFYLNLWPNRICLFYALLFFRANEAELCHWQNDDGIF